MQPEGSSPHSQAPTNARSILSTTPRQFRFLKIHFNIILPCTHGSYKLSLSLRLPHQYPVGTSPLLRTATSYPSHSSLFAHPINIWWGVQIIKLLFMKSSPLPCHLAPVRFKYPPQHPIIEHPQYMFLPRCDKPSFTPILLVFLLPFKGV